MSAERLRRYELVLLSLLVLVLPSLEALKTFFWFSYLVIYLARHYQQGNLSLLPQRPANIAITLFLLATLISTLVNWPFDNGLKGFHDEIRYCTLFLCLYGAGYTAKEYRQIAYLVIVGVHGGLVYGMVEFLLDIRTDFQFHSAGILTQSSIYLGIAILLNTGLLLDSESIKFRNLLKISLLIQLVALVYMGSRGSMLAVGMSFILLAILTLRPRTVVAWVSGLGVSLLLVSILIQVFPDNVFSKDLLKQYSIERIKESDHQRLAAWEIAFAKLGQADDLLWGIGPRNYKVINDMDFVTQNERLKQMIKYSHGHNLFLTQVIEQGIIGLLTMFYFFSLVLLRIIHAWRSAPNNKPSWSWYGGLGGFAIPIIAGMFNTPFYQEHAMLAMLLMGMMFALSERTMDKPSVAA
jgi:O-antigen ligase